MRTVLIAAVLLAGCGGPQAGETICATNSYGVTRCKSGPPVKDEDDEDEKQTAAPTPSAFWCTTRASDGFGYCLDQPGECEERRATGFAPCELRDHAVCASSGCFTTAESCAIAERRGRRSAAGCALRR